MGTYFFHKNVPTSSIIEPEPPKNAGNQDTKGLMPDYPLITDNTSRLGTAALTNIHFLLVSPDRLAGCYPLALLKSKVYPPPCLEPGAVPPEGKYPTPRMLHQATRQIDQVLHHTAHAAP